MKSKPCFKALSLCASIAFSMTAHAAPVNKAATGRKLLSASAVDWYTTTEMKSYPEMREHSETEMVFADEIAALRGSLRGYADSSRVTLSIPSSGYGSWAGANAPGQAISLEHDNDGVPNGVEYFMGLSGNGFTTNPAIDANRKVSWPKGAGYAGTYGTDYAVQSSTDLVNWSDVPVGDVTNGNPLEYTLPAGAAKIFTRLEVTGP